MLLNAEPIEKFHHKSSQTMLAITQNFLLAFEPNDYIFVVEQGVSKDMLLGLWKQGFETSRDAPAAYLCPSKASRSVGTFFALHFQLR